MSKRFSGLPSDIEHRTRPGRGADGKRGPGGWGTQGASATMRIAPPWIERPPHAQDFQFSATIVGLDQAAGPTLFPGSFTVPSGNVGVIRSVAILANGLLTSSDIVWALIYEGSPVSGWNALTIAPRSAGSVEKAWTPEETFIPIPENSTIQMRATVNDGGTYQVSASLHGWYYPQGIERAARSAYGWGG